MNKDKYYHFIVSSKGYGKTYQMIKDMQQQINNLNKFIKEYGNYLDSLHLDNQGIVYRAREKWNLLLKEIKEGNNDPNK